MRVAAPRSRRPSSALAALIVVLLASVVLRLVAALGLDSPWIAPDEMAYGLLGRAFWSTGHLQLLDGSSPSYGLFPLVAGLPLVLFGTAAGLGVLKGLEVVLLTATVFIVFVWTRGIVGSGWAVGGAALTAALPAFAYSGLIMSETAFVPAATLALWLLARALVRPSLGNQALVAGGIVVAVAMRLQGVVLLPTVVVAVLLHAWFQRDRKVLRHFVPTLATLLLAAAAATGLAVGLSPGALLGAYGVAAQHGYAVGPALRWIWRHAGDVYLLVLGAPLIATLILAVEAARGRERDDRVAAMLAVALSYSTLVVIQVGIFASRFVGQLDERALVSVAPPMFATFAVWLHRGLPRPQPAASLAALVAVAPALLLPVKSLVNTVAVPSAFMIVPLLSLLERTSADTLELVWLLGAAGVVLLTLLIPRRAAPFLVIAVVAGLAATSALVQTRIDRRAQGDRRLFFGSASPQWIDRAANGSVVYVDDGDALWNAAWHIAFWNARVRVVARLGPPRRIPLPGPVQVTARPDGRLARADGSSLRQRLVVTRRWVTLFGQRLAYHEQGQGEPGLTLWRTPSRPAVSTWTQGMAGRSDLVGPASVTVFACGSGRLELSLVAKRGLPTVAVSTGRLEPANLSLSPNTALEGWVPVAPARGGNRTCVFRLVPSGPVEVRRLVFRRGASAAVAAASRREASGATTFVQTGSTSLGHRENLGYCVGGTFQERPAGRYPDATRASFVLGVGLTCDPPPTGYVDKGLAPADLGVPENTYELYGPP